MSTIRMWIQTFQQHRYLLTLLVERDIKLKYRRSVLGYVWSVMNPLLVMFVLTLVFSHMFKQRIANYPVYLLVGRTMFSFLNESTQLGMRSVIGNAALLRKVYVPRYIFTVSKVTSCCVNYIFSLGALAIVMLCTRTMPTWRIILFPIPMIELYIFCLGVTLFLSAVNVYFRDTQYLYNAVLTLWMYLTPLFYPFEALPKRIAWLIGHFNPMYMYVQQARCFVLYGKMPTAYQFFAGWTAALGALFFGVWTFKRLQDNFILYI